MMGLVSRSEGPQNVRVAARSRIARAREASSALEDWIPSGLSGEQAPVSVVEAEAVPAQPAAAAELGAELQRLRREIGEAQKRADAEGSRADAAQREASELRDRMEAMKRAAARAAAVAHPEEGSDDPDAPLDLNSASFEQLRDAGLSVTQAARVIGQREQHGGFESVDEVDGIVGLPRHVKQTLKDTGAV